MRLVDSSIETPKGKVIPVAPNPAVLDPNAGCPITASAFAPFGLEGALLNRMTR